MKPLLAALLALSALPAFPAGAPAADGEKKGPKTTAEMTGLAAPPKANLKTKAEAKSRPDPGQAGTSQEVYDVPVKLQYTHETVIIPPKWRMSPKTRDLLRSEFHYQWSPDNMNCTTPVRWAHAVIGTDIAPCWAPDPEFFEPVKKFTIDGAPAQLYRRRKGAAGSSSATSEAIPGGSHMIVNFDINRRCYTMTFQTCEKWVQRFFPEFKFIMDQFKVNN